VYIAYSFVSLGSGQVRSDHVTKNILHLGSSHKKKILDLV
jgi:hypothetical protein